MCERHTAQPLPFAVRLSDGQCRCGTISYNAHGFQNGHSENITNAAFKKSPFPSLNRALVSFQDLRGDSPQPRGED